MNFIKSPSQVRKTHDQSIYTITELSQLDLGITIRFDGKLSNLIIRYYRGDQT